MWGWRDLNSRSTGLSDDWDLHPRALESALQRLLINHPVGRFQATRCSSYFHRPFRTGHRWSPSPFLAWPQPHYTDSIRLPRINSLLPFRLFYSFLAGPVGFEPTTSGLEGRCYIQTKPRAQQGRWPFCISAVERYKRYGLR